MKPRISREELDDMYNRQRLRLWKMANQLGVSVHTVCNWMDYYDLPRRTSGESQRHPLDAEEIERLYRQGWTATEIGQKLGVSQMTILHRLEEQGVERRNRSEASTIYPRSDFSGNLLEQAYLEGFRQGDLYVGMCNNGPNCATIEVKCSSTRQEQIDLLCDLFSPYGHVALPPLPNGGFRFSCRLNTTFRFLLPKRGSFPAWVVRAAESGNLSPFLACFAGYIDAEGSFHVQKAGQATFGLKSYDVALLRQAHSMLNEQLSSLPSRPSDSSQRYYG